MPKFVELWVYLSATPLFGLTATLLVYLLAQAAYTAARHAPWANPVFWTVTLLAGGLLLTGVPYPTYFAGAQFIHFLLGPAGLPPLQICLQVNIDGGANKSGVAPAELLALAAEVMKLPRLVLRGLMTIPEPVTGLDAQVAVHAKARALFDEVKAALNLPQFDTLSMGMTGDLEAAVRAGSTMVRVGTAVFGGRSKTA